MAFHIYILLEAWKYVEQVARYPYDLLLMIAL